MTSSHGQGHQLQHSGSSTCRRSPFLAPPQPGSRPHQTSYGYNSQAVSGYLHSPRPMFVTGYGYPGQPNVAFSSYGNPGQFRSNYSPNQSSLQSISDISSQYSSNDRSGRYMMPIPAQESQHQLPRPQSAPSQMGDSSSQVENGAPNASNAQSMDRFQWVAEPQPPPIVGVLSLNWSSDTDVTSFQYQGPFSSEIIEGMIKVKEDHRRNPGQNTSKVTVSQNTTESTVNSSGQQSALEPPSGMSTAPPGTNGNTEHISDTGTQAQQ